eukprot:CAMPEP_0114498656 /NCGR_PEP_ID=MMETSP0109-20121206/6990_1 /TAXON_ID=29199 /ORGANISM="Chlorarachnion reptans, Strain CCCM449" /LENGTH=464 /DNA_ID=CAMNT_0001676151 /DNA_START=149 /DNA_END=1543 /DNA_ORIENTATION=-
MSDLFVGKHFKLGKKLNSGSFGEIYRGINCANKAAVAIKLESRKSKFPQLVFESKVYRMLRGGTGIAKVHWTGKEGDFNVMVMDLLGPSLEDLFDFCGRRFSLKTTLMLADQLITRVEYMHSRNMIHRDIKPDNFVVGMGKRSSLIFIIDFGLAMKYRHHKTHQHVNYANGKNLTGTARYASINAHAGIQQSRRDDMESLGYLFVYFMKGSLPWQGLNKKNREDKFQAIWKLKESTSVDDLCRELPDAFSKYINYCRNLGFSDQPDYAYLKRLFRNLFFSQNFKMDQKYDWVQSPESDEKESDNRVSHAKSNPNGKSSKTGIEPDAAKRREAAVREFYNRRHSYGRMSADQMQRTKSKEVIAPTHSSPQNQKYPRSSMLNIPTKVPATNRSSDHQVRLNRKPGMKSPTKQQRSANMILTRRSHAPKPTGNERQQHTSLPKTHSMDTLPQYRRSRHGLDMKRAHK